MGLLRGTARVAGPKARYNWRGQRHNSESYARHDGNMSCYHVFFCDAVDTAIGTAVINCKMENEAQASVAIFQPGRWSINAAVKH